MSLSRRDFALYLALTPGIGGRSVTRILARNDLLARTPEEFMRLSSATLQEEYGLKVRQADRLAARVREKESPITELRDRLDKLGVTIVTATDAHYPVMIESMDPDPPGVLFLYGNQRLIGAKTMCVLSSRGTTPAGLDLMERLAEEAVLAGEIVVSGHDTPEYQRSALVPLRWGAPRILCLDRGLFEALGDTLQEEPFRAARLWRYQFDPHTDLVVSPFRPNGRFVGVNNQIRDRLIGCLAQRMDCVEISPAGNMEKVARLAIRAGRRVRVSDRSIAYRLMEQFGAEIILT